METRLDKKQFYPPLSNEGDQTLEFVKQTLKRTAMAHTKPTKEDLEAKAKAAIDAEPKPEPKKTPKKKTVVKKEETKEPKAKVEPKTEPQADPSKEIFKKKASESAKENQKIYAKNRVINKALIEAEETPEPTTQELEKEFKDWDIMSDIEKTFAKEVVISRNWKSKIKSAQDQAEKIEKWNDSVETFVEDPVTLNDNPELEGKTEAFADFAKEESNNSVPFNVLVGAFLHENSKGTVPNKGKMFEEGGGGPNTKPEPVSDKISLEESRKLRENDYGKWKELLIGGRIETDL